LVSTFLSCKQLSLFHHPERLSLLKADESTEARKLYMHTVCLTTVCSLFTVSTIFKKILFKQFMWITTSVLRLTWVEKIPLRL
jgi:hypothetical protein